MFKRELKETPLMEFSPLLVADLPYETGHCNGCGHPNRVLRYGACFECAPHVVINAKGVKGAFRQTETGLTWYDSGTLK